MNAGIFILFSAIQILCISLLLQPSRYSPIIGIIIKSFCVAHIPKNI